MPTLNIGGQRVKVDDSFLQLSPEEQNATVDEIARSLQPQPSTVDSMLAGMDNPVYGPGQVAPAPQRQEAAPAPYADGAFRASSEALHAGYMGGFDDEITAGMLAPIDAGIDWLKGEGFDMGRAYTRKQQAMDERKQSRRETHPVASLTGEVAGGLALGGGAAKAGLTTAGRSIPILTKAAPQTAAVVKAVGEGAAYGGLYGAGEAAPGERLAGAGTGAAIGGLTGGALQTAGNAIATRGARKAAQAATQTSDDLKTGALALKQQAMNEGVNFKQAATKRLAGNLKVAAGRPNERLRPLARGYSDEIDAIAMGDMSFEAFDEFRKGLNKTLKTASGEDQIALLRMKTVLDSFADNATPGTFTGDAKKATALYNQYKTEYSKSKQTEVIEKIMDNADRKGAGKFTQGGFANAVKNEMEKLYTAIQKGTERGWSKEQVALIRQMAKGGSTSTVLNLLSKFDPKGVVSAGIGFGIGGPVLPVAGHVAARMRERGMESAANALLSGASTGTAPRIAGQITRKAPPFIGAGVAASTEVPRLLEGRR